MFSTNKLRTRTQFFKHWQKPYFKQDLFCLVSLKTFSAVHRSIYLAIKNVSTNSEGLDHQVGLNWEGLNCWLDYQRNIVDNFNIDWINQWYLSKNEASCPINFKVIRPNKYFQINLKEIHCTWWNFDGAHTIWRSNYHREKRLW